VACFYGPFIPLFTVPVAALSNTWNSIDVNDE